MKYKKPLTIKEQVNYLKDVKRVVYNFINKETAEKILYRFNYINIITPFKHRFFKTDKSGNPLKDENSRHIYERDIDFGEYYSYYKKERSKYPKLFASLLKFEESFNAILSYETIHYYSITDSCRFILFTERLKKNARESSSTNAAKAHMIKTIDTFQDQMDKYGSIYIFLDRLSLSDISTVFKCSDKLLKERIFRNLYAYHSTFGYEDLNTFESILPIIAQVRNYVCHGNSLDILCMYYNIKEKGIRSRSDRRKYRNVINRISEANKATKSHK